MGRGRYSEEQQAFYTRYLNSQAWREKKAARIAKAGGRCEFEAMKLGPRGFDHYRCTRTRYLCVHHSTYERLGAEMDKDLDVFCWYHHVLEHLLWKRCPVCTVPCLEHDEAGEKWLSAVLATTGIDLDKGPVNWKILPNKEFFLLQVPSACPKHFQPFDKEDA